MIKLGLWIVSLSDAPVFLYVILEADSGHPTGLALLAVFGTLLGGALLVFGLLLARVRQNAL